MNEHTVPLAVEPDVNANATDLLIDRAKATPDAALFSVPDGVGGWADVTAAEFLHQVRALAKGLIASGIAPGDVVGLMCRTRYEWTLVDFATWFAGALLVPVYETSSPSQVHWNLSDSGAVAVILETADHFARFDEVHPELPDVANVWQIDLGDLDKLAAAGAGVADEELERRRSAAGPSDLATIIYTSGTTGRPRGCMLTHANFVETSRNAAVAMADVVAPGSSTLLFITTAHVFARFIAVMSVHAGVRVGHQADTKQLLPSLASFRPSFLLAVPRVFEKVYNSAEQKAEAGGRGAIFRRAVAVAIAHSKALDEGVVPLGLRLRFALFDRLVYSKLKKAMGGNIRYAVSGSAPLGTRLGHFFRSLDIRILEGYGLTETTAPASVNLVTRFKIGTVGPALPGVTLRTDDDGEVLIKGENVFAGYWKDPEGTAEVLRDGWFRTGDLGSLDSDGYLTITGRKKEIIVTAGGKNVAPAVLEDPIRANPLVAQVVVVGDQKPFISALVTLDTEMLPVWLNNAGEAADMPLAEAAEHPKVLAEIQRAVDEANTAVSRAESIRKFVVLPVELTEQSGHLTPKMSVKRAVVLKDFAPQIGDLYTVFPSTESVRTVTPPTR
ncbi:AMP-dependent synthetase/ligase [Frigoribacterium faeni]|uniref:Acyl-CoA synthetase n=1 Tax=Frigoribacterium faeni TaxID=145483 RepID=A0A7W3JHU4_9MICO|nr:AMP-dependent synthetase/ligase [Frigoribacterium faeni]MBA8813019.1 long-chain acyl-CoA synthetase [Frigoribacterium faeni]BFF14197.1 AMP-dependent synthetase/ligase [Microbacterium flavescens]GEK82058.1 long-chain-fatty-acid--CoA ligase [Frigoribacterium faeni]